MNKGIILENILCFLAGFLFALWAVALLAGYGSEGFFKLLGYE